MKKRKTSFAIVILLFISLIIFLPYGQCEETNDNDIKTEFSSIQEAIDTTFEGDTVYIYGGEYHEDILINKSLILEGKPLNGYDPVIIGNVTIAANNVTISNLYIQNGSGIRIIGFAGSMYDVIYNNITIKNNVIKNNLDYGITIRWAYDINIINNIIEENNGGIIFHFVKNSIIENNALNKNQDYAIYIKENESNDNNVIFHNSFINNSKNAYDGGKNFWNASNLKEGNYWDDYTGIDRNLQDGIGDIPYDIEGGINQDKYPLMSPYECRIILDKYTVNRESVQTMLIVGIIVAIIFCLPIGFWWRKKYFR